MGAAQVERFDIGFDDLSVFGPATLEPFFNEGDQVLLGHVDQVGQASHDHHVGGPVVAGGLCQFFEWQAEAPVVVLDFELVRVEYNYAIWEHVFDVFVVGIPVKRHQDVYVISWG